MLVVGDRGFEGEVVGAFSLPKQYLMKDLLEKDRHKTDQKKQGCEKSFAC